MQIRILIIDDDDELLFLADRFIGGTGSQFELIPVSNGQEALQKLEEEEIDAIVCDYDLGPNEMDGLEILEWIREADNQIPFIIFTGQSREEVAIRALNSGADYYLQKSADLKSAFNELSHHIENVVKHRKLELALEKSEESHRLLVHSLNDMIFVYDKDDYCIQYYAAKKEDLFLPPEQFMNRHVSEYMPPQVCQPYLEHSKKVRLSGESEEFEYYFDMMGERRWFITDLELHDDGESVISVVRSITEKRFTEHALKIAQFSIDSNTDPIMWIGPKAEIVYVNDATCRIFEYTQEEFLGMKITDIYPTFEDERWPSFWNELKEQKSVTFESVMQTKSGKTHPVEISVNYAELEGKEYAFACGRDISKHEQAKKALEESEKKFRSLYMEAPLAYHSLDNEGNLIEVNNTWLKTLDYKREEVIGKSVGKLLTPKSKDTFRTQFPKFKEEGEINSVRFEMVRGDGKIIQVSIDGVISLDDFGRFSHTHCIIQDISERVRTEQILKEHEQVLLNQKKELSDFVHSMSHDIGNSLSVIKGLTELMSKDPDSDVVSRITQTVQMMRDLLDSSVTLADAGQVIGDKQVVSLGQIMDQVAKTIISDDITYKRDELPLVSGDRQKISQIFQNIVANAVTHGSPSIIEIKFEHSETGPIVIITNDGNPIPPKIQSRLFKGDIRSRKRGEGLGLIIVRKLVDAHGWEIDYMPDPQPAFRIHLGQIVE